MESQETQGNAEAVETVDSYLAFDIGGTKIASGLVTFGDEAMPTVAYRDSIPTDAHRGGDDVCRRLVEYAQRLLQQYAEAGRRVAGIGIAAAGVPDTKTGEILAATDTLPGWKGQRIYDALRAVSNLPIVMIGDVGGHGLGEALYGAGSGAETVLSIGVGTGIGGAIVMQGKLITGAHGVAGHAGHMPCALACGIACSCGTTSGHVEAVASGSGLATLYNTKKSAAVLAVKNGYEVCVRAERDEPFACEILEMSAQALGECVAGMANLIDPDVIVMSGSVVNAGERWWKALRRSFTDSALELVKATPLVMGALGGTAPLIGAACAVRSRELENSENLR